MFFEEIKRSEHFKKYHKGSLSWSEIIHLIYAIKNKRKIDNKIKIENDKVYILCEIKLYML